MKRLPYNNREIYSKNLKYNTRIIVTLDYQPNYVYVNFCVRPVYGVNTSKYVVHIPKIPKKKYKIPYNACCHMGY
jgi:hypothetical protein